MVQVVAKNYIREDKIDDFLNLAKRLVIETNNKDRGCMRYQLHQDLNNPQILTFIEEWETMEALQAHMEADHFKEIVPQFGKMSEKPEEVHLYKQL